MTTVDRPACSCCYTHGHRTPCDRPVKADVPTYGIALDASADAFPCGAVFVRNGFGGRSFSEERTAKQRRAWGLL